MPYVNTEAERKEWSCPHRSILNKRINHETNLILLTMCLLFIKPDCVSSISAPVQILIFSKYKSYDFKQRYKMPIVN